MASQPPNDLPADLRDAMASLPGDPQSAREKARAGLASPTPDPRFWIIAGQASRMLEDWQDLEIVADGLLTAAPNAVLGLIWKGDALSQRGELRLASAHYAGAKRAAADADVPLPDATVRDLERVDLELSEIRRTYSFYLEEELRKKGITTENTSRSFAEAFAALAGTHEPEMGLQRPTMLFYPGLPESRFYDKTDFEWAAALEAETDAIRSELHGVIEQDADFRPYIEGTAEEAAAAAVQVQDGSGLSAYLLWDHGRPVEDHLGRCPATAAALEPVPQPDLTGRCPVAAFWRLSGGIEIPARNGMLNCRLIAHLPLIVPPGAGVIVDGERRDWNAGELLIFNDSIGHQIRNESDEDAIVLLFDVARPEIGEQDWAALSALFAAVDSFR
ncbi:aspartyl/asparaginyl beta-hydroxylase domain-containing protein [uncultured Parasphingopyxis sp.]|uniref:aspartyl/asparaginyl beta-hydroxylase domain-containing protein n=1 Tax=uncultured Parasphingopyxis sp. TaxID=1547918 RepID=UPI002632A2F3|nr:aspartyl/asparaginyl beta-hydroxylase domain-containing protein [uncultured Parasphingopyxis sp.]